MNKVSLLFYSLFINVSCLIGQNIIDTRVDSLFKTHILSLNVSFFNLSIRNSSVKQSDDVFLDMFYYLSGLKLGQEEHSYGRHPRYINKVDVRALENWYSTHKELITYERIKRIYHLIGEYSTIEAKDLDELEQQSKKIDIELDALRIK